MYYGNMYSNILAYFVEDFKRAIYFFEELIMDDTDELIDVRQNCVTRQISHYGVSIEIDIEIHVIRDMQRLHIANPSLIFERIISMYAYMKFRDEDEPAECRPR